MASTHRRRATAGHLAYAGVWYHDNDTVSFRYDAINAANPDRATVERYRKELGVTTTAQETIWQYHRSAGFVLAQGLQQSFFDLHGGYFDDPQLMAEVQRLNTLCADAMHHDGSSVAEIVVVSDETSNAYATFESGFLQQTLQPAQVQLAKVGAPHDSILVDDLAIADLERHKLVIFLNCFHLTGTQRDLIRRQVLNRGRTVLWCYAPGLFDGNCCAVEAMRELSGLQLSVATDPARVRLRIALGSQPFAGLERLPDRLVGHEHVWARAVSITDPQATPLGVLEGRRDVALAVKPMPGWTSIFTRNPVLPAAVLRVFARRAGVHLYNERDDTLYAGASFLAVNADGAGPRTLQFPYPADVFDPFSGDPLALKNGVLRFRRDGPSAGVRRTDFSFRGQNAFPMLGHMTAKTEICTSDPLSHAPPLLNR
ncbi:MAG: hypothetical protein NTY19_21375 [Planctomycetota bacterium]|nr:hypothetical protein [Planctomycetota bacterium]